MLEHHNNNIILLNYLIKSFSKIKKYFSYFKAKDQFTINFDKKYIVRRHIFTSVNIIISVDILKTFETHGIIIY